MLLLEATDTKQAGKIEQVTAWTGRKTVEQTSKWTPKKSGEFSQKLRVAHVRSVLPTLAASNQPMEETERANRRKAAPPAFREVFVRWGWRGIEQVYGARTDCNRRWIEELGGDQLLQERRAYRRRVSDIRYRYGNRCS